MSYSASRWDSPAPGEDDEVADFAASLLQPPATEDGAGAKDSGATEHDAAAAAASRIDWASCYVPLHDHDAHFGIAKRGILGVADGVDTYAEYGMDTGAFCRGLMTSASTEVVGLEPSTRVCPCALLERANDETTASGVRRRRRS